MKKILVILLLLVLGQQAVKAQITDLPDNLRSSRIDSLLYDVLFADDELSRLLGLDKNFQFLYFRANYDTRTTFAGREIGDNQYNLSGQLYYMHSVGIYAGVSGSWYSQFDPGYRATVLSLGYSKGLQRLKFFRYRISYDYYLFNNNIPDFDPLYTSSINSGFTLRSKSVGTSFDASLLLGDDVSSQFNWAAYAYINLIKLGGFNKIRLEPEASMYFGTEAAAFLLGEVYVDPETNEEYDIYYQDKFGLLNIQFQLPLSLNLKNFDLRFSYIYNLTRQAGDAFDYPETSSFRLSLSYLFNL
ncbi:hypothetical protein [Gaoshiqia sp. Z1-71]|uniref:hypothetical protein n=1 Tax=Gaoshiqia hydrogeniformans TaxID=3290090 RepID=UPI003BF8F1E2